MPENKDFALRLEIIDECLRNHLRPWTLKRLLECVNERLQDRYGKKASKRTLQNDIKYLTDEKSAPIQKRKEGSATYFYYADKQFSIKNLPIGEEEVNRLKDAIAILRQVSDFSLLDEVGGIIGKLENTISTHNNNTAPIIQFEKHTVARGTEYIDDLYEAIKGQTALKLRYKPFGKPADNCTCHPYLLKEYRNRWFLIGRKSNYSTVTVFALDRIESLKPTADSFIANDLFDPDTYFNSLIGVTVPTGSVPEAIEIKVIPAQAPYIRTKPIHHSQEIIREYKNGGLLVRLWLVPNYELTATLLSYGADIEVQKPYTLREQIKTILASASQHYKT